MYLDYTRINVCDFLRSVIWYVESRLSFKMRWFQTGPQREHHLLRG